MSSTIYQKVIDIIIKFKKLKICKFIFHFNYSYYYYEPIVFYVQFKIRIVDKSCATITCNKNEQCIFVFYVLQLILILKIQDINKNKPEYNYFNKSIFILISKEIYKIKSFFIKIFL